MHNELFKIGPFVFYGYGVMIAIGCALALLLACYRAKKSKLDTSIIMDLFVFCLIGGFLGAKLLYCIVKIKDFIANPIMFFANSGFVVYGGILMGILVGFLYCKRKKINFLQYADLVIPSIPLAQGFGRIGCFLAGCCYGARTNAWYGVVFPIGSLAPSGIPLIPTQLISSLGDFLICGILLFASKKSLKQGILTILYIALYSIGRFCIEFLRADYRGEIGMFTTSQLISLVLFFVVVIYLVCEIIKNKKKQ